MAIPVLMPRQGQSVETCILGQWYKTVGEPVKTGDILFSYETDKASFEEEAKADGVLLAVFFNEGDEIPVLTNIAVIGQPGESYAEFVPGGAPVVGTVENTAPDEVPVVFEFEVDPGDLPDHLRISPLAKNMAAKLGVDIYALKGSGPHGRIIARDVEAAADTVSKPETTAASVKQKVQPAVVVHEKGDDFEIRPVSNIRKLIANAMHQSLQNSAQLTHHLSADARQLQRLRKKFKTEYAEGKIKQNITINDLVCYVVIRALEKFPQANTHFLGDKIKWFNKVHLGLAVDTDRGLMVPAVKNASDLSLAGLSAQMQQLASQARGGNINPDLLNPEAATFTISNLGNYGVEMFTPVINLPQVAILGVCAIIPRPKEIEEGVYGFVPMIGLSLTYNHQALDGGEATRFLAEIRNQIENLTV